MFFWLGLLMVWLHNNEGPICLYGILFYHWMQMLWYVFHFLVCFIVFLLQGHMIDVISIQYLVEVSAGDRDVDLCTVDLNELSLDAVSRRYIPLNCQGR
jgi:hypothetical protein